MDFGFLAFGVIDFGFLVFGIFTVHPLDYKTSSILGIHNKIALIESKDWNIWNPSICQLVITKEKYAFKWCWTRYLWQKLESLKGLGNDIFLMKNWSILCTFFLLSAASIDLKF